MTSVRKIVCRVAALATFLTATLMTLGACEWTGGFGCTLIGCVNGVSVTLSPKPAGVYSLALLVPGDTTRRVIDCPDAARCNGVFHFANVTAPSVTVLVTVGADEFRRQVEPTYTTRRPNGAGCDPVCRDGAVTVVLPVAARSTATR